MFVHSTTSFTAIARFTGEQDKHQLAVCVLESTRKGRNASMASHKSLILLFKREEEKIFDGKRKKEEKRKRRREKK